MQPDTQITDEAFGADRALVASDGAAARLHPSGFDHGEGFTPGPWMRDGFTVTNFAPAGEKRWPIATTYPDTRLSAAASYKRMVENARLIAAAPDLYEQLKRLTAYVRSPLQMPNADREADRRAALVKSAETALAEARGEVA